MNAIYVNHNTGEQYKDKNEAMAAYRAGVRIDLYSWSDVCGEMIMRGYWDVD